MFRLGQRTKLVGRVPVFDLLKENNARKGFVAEAEFQAIKEKLPECLRPLAEVAYLTGWRKGELLSREWRHVDLKNGWLRLEPGETKNDEPRNFPLFPRLRAVLEEQERRKLAIETETGTIVRALFFRDSGKPIRDFRKQWKRVSPDRYFHDLRRTAARNLIRAGTPEPVAMKLTGHLTPSIFRRYGIVDEAMLREGVEKLAEHLEDTSHPDRSVVAFRRAQ